MDPLSEIKIRDAHEDDRAAIRELTLKAYSEYAAVMAPTAWAGLDQAVRTALDTAEGAERIVAEQDGRIVGSVMLYPPSSDAYRGVTVRADAPELRLLAVAPEMRGRGIGQALVKECIQRARRMGAGELGLHTSKSMQPAIAMYRRMGFVRAPEQDFQPAGAELVEGYRLSLSEPELDAEDGS